MIELADIFHSRDRQLSSIVVTMIVCVCRRDMTRLEAPTQVASTASLLCHWQALPFLPYTTTTILTTNINITTIPHICHLFYTTAI